MHRRQYAGRAKAALQGVVLAECLLQGRKIIAERQAFDRDYLGAIGLNCEDQAGAYRRAIDNHGACAADTMLTAQMRACQPQLPAQQPSERQPRLDTGLDRSTIDPQRDRDIGHAASPGRVAAADDNARSTMTRMRALR